MRPTLHTLALACATPAVAAPAAAADPGTDLPVPRRLRSPVPTEP